MKKRPAEIKQLVQSVSFGDADSAEELFRVVYDELHRIASSYMNQERANHTLQPTALINEAFLKLVPDGQEAHAYEDLNHFVATASLVMRRILVNHAKAKKAAKRGGGKVVFELQEPADVFNDSAIDLIALDDAMQQLAELDETQHRIVELRFFGGMTTKQCAEVLGISERSAFYEWAHARAWLKSQIEGASS